MPTDRGRNFRLHIALGALLLTAAASPVRAEPSWFGAEDSDGREIWQLHLQATGIYQAHPSIRSPYQGPNSLRAKAEIRQTISATLFAGLRLTDGLALYFNPEMAQGFGLSNTLGVAGFVNGEAQKSGANTPKFYAARYFFRQVIGLGGETEMLESAQNQLAERVDVSRLTFTLGKFAANDMFDVNDYAHDPRRDFMNWSIWESAAWDYPADVRGYTYGAAVELNQKDWALRGGWFLMPKEANVKPLAANFLHYQGLVVEAELRHEIDAHPGKVRVLFFANRSHAGDYRQTLALMPVNPDITTTRTPRTKFGFAINLQQELAEDLGAFARLSWNDGRTESYVFADIDRSIAAGLSLKGKSWRRPDDTIGLAYNINALSRPHRDYFAAGGTGGLTIGDGQLRYDTERILEAYYSAQLAEPFAVTLNYQYVENPAYNQDRGPVSFFGIRLHFQM